MRCNRDGMRCWVPPIVFLSHLSFFDKIGRRRSHSTRNWLPYCAFVGFCASVTLAWHVKSVSVHASVLPTLPSLSVDAGSVSLRRQPDHHYYHGRNTLQVRQKGRSKISRGDARHKNRSVYHQGDTRFVCFVYQAKTVPSFGSTELHW